MGRGTLSASHGLASSMVLKPRNQCIDHGTDSAGGRVGFIKILHRHFMAYSKGYRVCIGSSKPVVRAHLSDVPRNNL